MLRNRRSSTAGSNDGITVSDNANSKRFSLAAVDFDKLASSVQGRFHLRLAKGQSVDVSSMCVEQDSLQEIVDKLSLMVVHLHGRMPSCSTVAVLSERFDKLSSVTSSDGLGSARLAKQVASISTTGTAAAKLSDSSTQYPAQQTTSTSSSSNKPQPGTFHIRETGLTAHGEQTIPTTTTSTTTIDDD
eukprot:21488-Heterococcus_DN1.PRE.1